MKHAANILTLGRLAVLPFIIILMFIPASWAAWTVLCLYLFGAVTDFFDGWVARKFDLVSDVGALIDPIADKVFVVSVLIMLVAIDRIEGLWVIAVLVILMREFLVAGLREFLGPRNVKLPVIPLAKWKTAIQMLATCLLIVAPYVPFGSILGLACLSGAAILTLVTGWEYTKSAMPHIDI